MTPKPSPQIWFAVIVALFLVGCGKPYRIDLDLAKNTIQEAGLISSISPAYDKFDRLAGFVLTIKNDTGREVELIWQKSYYLRNGELDGFLLFTPAPDTNDPRPRPSELIFAATKMYEDPEMIYWTYYEPPERIPSGTTLRRFAFPINRLTPSVSLGLYGDPLPDGENGLALTLKADGTERITKMLISVKRIPEPDHDSHKPSQPKP